MLQYKISSYNSVTHYLQVEFNFKIKKPGTTVELIVPAWRPGRYEGANYVKNFRDLKITSPSGQNVLFQKTSLNTWLLDPVEQSVKITYSYFAFQMDAGASYIDDEFWIINFLNCLIYPNGYELDPCLLEIHIPESWESATTLKKKNNTSNTYIAENYFQLTDRPLLAAKKLKHLNYNVQNIPFHLIVHGESPVNLNEILPSFEAFSKAQLDTFNSCPFDQYYFLIIILPFRFYHGVEHSDNTVLVLGIDEGGSTEKFVDDLLGVSSHELFHAWNIKKIRPKELLPYDFKNFKLFNTGMIAEGFTTYYGDLFLVRSGTWTISRYLEEMNQFLKRHYRNPGRFFSSLTTSSENLWIDGYKPGAPFHKVSIYVKGAIVSMMLDMNIRITSNHRYSLDDIMRWMDEEELSSNGYSLDDLQKKAEELTDKDFQNFFDDYVYGTISVTDELKRLCNYFGLILFEQPAEDLLKRYFGIATSLKEDHLLIEMIEINSPAEEYLSIGDQILYINGEKPVGITSRQIDPSQDLQLGIKRLGRIFQINIIHSENNFFSFYQLKKNENCSQEQQAHLKTWLS